ncbi:MAG: ABC transporter substrate-binding protein [Fusobacteriota bacterium]
MKKRGLKMSVVLFVLILGVTSFGKTTLDVACFPDQDSGFESILDDFHAEYPDIEVNLIVNGFAEHHDALLTQIASGANVPDVAVIEIGYIGNFVSKGGFLNLKESPYNAQQYKDNFVAYKWGQATSGDGRLLAMPLDIAPGTIFARKDRLNEIGYSVDDMTTMEKWLEAGLKFAEDEDGDGTNDRWLVPDASDIYYMIAKSGKERYFDEDGNVIVDNDRFLRAFKMAKKVRDLGLDGGIGAWTNEWYEAFKQGLVLMQPSGAWLGGHLKNWMAPDTAGKWRALNLPDDMYINWGGSFAGIPEQSDNKEAAWKFIKFVSTTKEAQIEQFKSSNIFPAWKPAFDDPIFEEEVEFFGGQKVRKQWAEAATKVPVVVTDKFDTMADEIVQTALTDVLENDRDPEEALREAKMLIQRRVRRRR